MKIHNLFICSSVCSYTVGAFCFLFTAFHQKVFLSHLPLFEFKYKIFTRLFIRYTSSTLLENRFLGLRKFLVCIRFCSCTQVYASYASVRIKYHFQLAENDVIEPLHFVPQNSGPGCYNLYFRWMKKKIAVIWGTVEGMYNMESGKWNTYRQSPVYSGGSVPGSMP